MQDMTKEELREMRIQVCIAWLSAQYQKSTRPPNHQFNYPKNHVAKWAGTYVGASHFVEAMKRIGFRHSDDDKLYPTPWLSRHIVFPDYSRLDGMGIQPWVGDGFVKPVRYDYVSGPRYRPYRAIEGQEELTKYRDVDEAIQKAIEARKEAISGLPVLPYGWERCSFTTP